MIIQVTIAVVLMLVVLPLGTFLGLWLAWKFTR